jgi:peroxiredoxin
MRNRSKFILTYLALAGAIFLFGYYFFYERDRPAKRENLKPGVAAQDFELPDLKGDRIRLSDYRGRVVFLNIWATWCPPCREEMPSMELLYQALKRREFEMLAVSIDQGGEKAVRPFAANYGLTFPVLLDPEKKTYQLYGLTGVPETFIIDRTGMIIQKIIGPQDWINRNWLNYFEGIIR